MRILLSALAALAVTGGIQLPAPAAQGLPVAQVQTTAPVLSPQDFRKLTKTAYFLIDVRQPDEFAAGHIDGAVLMPLDQLPAQYKRIPKGVKLVVYCRTGHRSAQAVTFLRSNGYDTAVSLDGGFIAWNAKI